jgi:hypothetical protein
MTHEGPIHAHAGEAHPERWLDILSTVLLALATVATAWAGYQSSRWHGEQAEAQSASIAARVESTRASSLASQQIQIDLAIFTQWIDAYAQGDAELADFYRKRFRKEFEPAFSAWIATKPRTNPNAPLSPFAMPMYKLAASEEADRLEAEAAASSEDVKVDIQRADNYVLAVVLFATSLFFAGISTKLPTRGTRAAILGLGCVLFSATVVWIATFPVTVSV